ncbi:ABC transporter substrate-binding protein [Microbacterium sp. CH12i]|nr:ABC transporter substrate-binding protein [Microbacterium sp. CH12i]
MSSTPISRAVGVLTCLAFVGSLVGCGLSVPSDPDGTLATVTSGELRVGVSPDSGLVDVSSADPTGPLVDLVDEFTETIDANAEWTVGSEETLVGMLEAGDLDLLVGGFTDQSPWSDRAGITRGYTAIDGADGRSLVFLVPLGENAFLTKLETFLDEEVGP